jgi:hypothetical protein
VAGDVTKWFFSGIAGGLQAYGKDIKDVRDLHDMLERNTQLSGGDFKQGMLQTETQLGIKSTQAQQNNPSERFRLMNEAFPQYQRSLAAYKDDGMVLAKEAKAEEDAKAGIRKPVKDGQNLVLNNKAGKSTKEKADYISAAFGRTIRDEFSDNDFTSSVPGRRDDLTQGFKKEGKKKGATETKVLSEVKKNLITTEDLAGIIALNLSFAAMQTSISTVNSSVDILSHYFVEGIFSSKQDPFKHISDAFGDFAKKMAADLVALIAKILFFRGLLAVLSATTGGAGAGLIPFVTQVASATTGVKFASGTDQVVTKPTMFMAGESGRERVTVTPRAKMSSSGGGEGLTVVIQGNVLDGAQFVDFVEMANAKLKRRLI